MPARLSSSQPSTTVASTRLRVGVSTSSPTAAVSVATAATDVAYIFLSVANLSSATLAAQTAYQPLSAATAVDDTGRFRYVPEIVIVSDAVSLAVTKALSSPEIMLSDTTVFDTVKGLSDSVGFTEVFLATLVFLRDLADTAVVSDAHAVAFSKPATDSVSASDASVRSFFKNLTSGVAMNDSFAAGDGLTYSFAKGITNVVFAADAANFSHSKSVSDMIGTTDAGVLAIQNYCDITYFAEDYVGEFRTFS